MEIMIAQVLQIVITRVKSKATGKFVGGLSGGNYNNGTITNCYYDSTVYTGAAIGTNSGTTTKIEGKTTEQYKDR